MSCIGDLAGNLTGVGRLLLTKPFLQPFLTALQVCHL